MRLALILLALGLQGCSGAVLSAQIESPVAAIALFVTALLACLAALLLSDQIEGWLDAVAPLGALCVAVSACTPAQAAPLDMQRVGNAICELESRHLNNPLLAIGDGGQSRGECQISIDTALWILPYAIKRGFVPGYMHTMAKDREAFKWFLHYPPINRGLTDAYLDKIRRKRGARTIERLAYFWNAGINSDRFGAKSDAVAFAGEVRIMYLGPPKASSKER